MNISEQMQKFNKRWNTSSDVSYEEEFKKFKTRILDIVKDIDDHLSKDSITEFCQFYGIPERWSTNDYSGHKWSSNVEDKFKSETNEIEFYRLIEILFTLKIYEKSDYSRQIVFSRNILFKKIQKALEFSNVNLTIAAVDGDVVLYPKGEKLLDEELVNLPLSFLDKTSASHFTDALSFYQSKNSIKSADSLRRSLEEFLKYKLKNTKGLKANLVEFQIKLKSDGGDAQIRNVIGSIPSFLDSFFNENTKHNDGDINENENEFLIYQIGLLLRYFDKNL